MAPGMITLHEFTRSIESYSIEYYKSCILKTNQFSTKYILQKLIESHKRHQLKIEAVLENDNDFSVEVRLLEEFRQNFNPAGIFGSVNVENLNFVEAAKLGIGLINYQIMFYRQIVNDIKDTELRQELEKLVILKTDHRKDLQAESERLTYKK